MPVKTASVLLVDDEVTVRSVLRAALEREGFTVYEAGNYYEGLKIATEREFVDVLIADVSLPGPNGCELAKRVLGLQRKTTVLFISGYAGAEVCRHNGVELHDLHFMAKPIDGRSLVNRINRLLEAKDSDDNPLPIWFSPEQSLD
jgi:DNA-binding response OmpR family regulator